MWEMEQDDKEKCKKQPQLSGSTFMEVTMKKKTKTRRKEKITQAEWSSKETLGGNKKAFLRDVCRKTGEMTRMGEELEVS